MPRSPGLVRPWSFLLARRRRRRGRRYLFILSHMRSYSSLLSHILGSHPDVKGYVETHRSYSTDADLHSLEASVADDPQVPWDGRYVLDKILHGHAEVDEAILGRDDVDAIFLVREPEHAVRSIVAMGFERKNLDWKSDPRKAAEYYRRRLGQLVDMAADKPHRSVFLEADRLIDDTEVVLARLTRFLGLASPLRSKYDTFELTGKRRYGDPGKYIKTGVVVAEREDYGDIEVPEPVMRKALAAFAEAREMLSSRCEKVI